MQEAAAQQGQLSKALLPLSLQPQEPLCQLCNPKTEAKQEPFHLHVPEAITGSSWEALSWGERMAWGVLPMREKAVRRQGRTQHFSASPLCY